MSKLFDIATIKEPLFIYLMQSAIFAVTIVIASKFFDDKDILEQILLSTVNESTIWIATANFLAIIFVAGILTMIEKIRSNILHSNILHSNIYGTQGVNIQTLDKVIQEIPKVFYLVGSSVGVVGMVIALPIANDDKFYVNLFLKALFIYIGYFIMGLIFSTLLTKKGQNNAQ